MIFLKYIRPLSFLCFINFSVLLSFNTEASECGVLQLQKNRSSGINIKSNKCSALPDISVGTVFDLAAQGRLWLKSSAAENGEQGFHMICQNRTGQSIQLEFSKPLSPWLNVEKLKDCNDWTDNKLSCGGDSTKKRGIYCVLAFLKPVLKNNSGKMSRTASVKMRTFDLRTETNSHLGKQQLLEALRPELKLCKQLYEISQDIHVNWIVQMTKVKMFEVASVGVQKNQGLADCIESVVTTVSYPMSSTRESFNSVF